MAEWLVLAHATEARIYDLSKKNIKPHEALIKTLVHDQGRLQNHDLVSDKGGDYGKGANKVGAAAFTKDHSPHEMELNYFMEQLAHYLEHERTQNHVSKLVVAMDAHLYGIFEAHLSREVQKLIVKYFHKNYLPLPLAELEQVVSKIQQDFY